MVTAMSLLASVLLIGVATPMIQRRVRPNPWYGFRTPKTLADETIWYAANEYSGRMLQRAGWATLIGVGLLAFLPLPAMAKAMADTAVILAGVLGATAASYTYLRTL